MKNFQFTCPHCSEMYNIKIYDLGQSDVYELRCDRCSATLSLHIYEKHFKELYERSGMSYSRTFETELEESLGKCSCGGRFRADAPYRCKRCNAPVSIEEIKKQIDWWGTADGIPGVVINKKANATEVWKR